HTEKVDVRGVFARPRNGSSEIPHRALTLGGRVRAYHRGSRTPHTPTGSGGSIDESRSHPYPSRRPDRRRCRGRRGLPGPLGRRGRTGRAGRAAAQQRLLVRPGRGGTAGRGARARPVARRQPEPEGPAPAAVRPPGRGAPRGVPASAGGEPRGRPAGGERSEGGAAEPGARPGRGHLPELLIVPR